MCVSKEYLYVFINKFVFILFIKFLGSVDTTLIIPFLPSDISEDDLWSIFPLANIIAIPTDCKPE